MLWQKVDKLLKKNNRTMYYLRDGKIKKPSFELMCKIADALDVSLDYFRKDKY